MEFRCAIAAPHDLAVDAGERALRNGGNAIDAALAAAAVLTVVYPHMCSVGGDLFALVAEADGSVTAIDSSGPAGGSIDGADLRRRHGSMPITGPDTITVPGVLAGWEELAALGSAAGLADAVRAAAELARDGVQVTPSLARAITSHRSQLSLDPGMSAVFHPDGNPLGEGATLVQPALARSLDEIAANGKSAFYGGPVGDRLVQGLREVGSRLQPEDLAGYSAERTAPLSGHFGGYEVMTSPPGSQGFALIEILNAISRIDDASLLENDADLLSRIFHLSSRDRDAYLADPRRVEVPLARLTSDEHAEWLLDRARSEMGRVGMTPPGRPRPTGDTVAVVATDSDGRAVSLIQSVFHSFGSGILEPETGIICHNRGACFTLDPDSPNRIEPGKRPAHTLMPVLLRDGEGRVSAHGTMGGRAQPQIHTQLLLRRLAGASPREAVSGHRFVVGGLDAGSELDVIFAERGLGADTVEALDRTGFEVRTGDQLDEIVGHTQIAVHTASGLDAASDPRADGAGRVIESNRTSG